MHPVQPAKALALAGWLGLSLAVCSLPGCATQPLVARAAPDRFDLRTVLDRLDQRRTQLCAFYSARNHRPLWVQGTTLRQEAQDLLGLLADADRDGLDAARYRVAELTQVVAAAASGTPAALVRAEIELSRALASYAADLRQPLDRAAMVYIDPDLAPPQPSIRDVLEAAASAPSLREHLLALPRLNPLYEQLRQALADYRAHWSGLPRVIVPPGPELKVGARGERVRLLRARLGAKAGAAVQRFDQDLARMLLRFQTVHGLTPTGRADARTVAALNAGPEVYERRLRASLERARALPAKLGRRYLLVDVAAAQLWFYEDGQVRDSMRVVVGKPSQQTPMMAARIRFALLNPYWNLPPDLVATRIAQPVLREGVGHLRKGPFEVLSDWSDHARALDPKKIDWAAAATGRLELRVRQLPGPKNMMGSVKFMLPNRLGIYLHDTPDKALFAKPERTFSSGCIRLEHAHRLARWLLPPTAHKIPRSRVERRVDLPEPVPVYITYLTAAPTQDGIAFRPDVYSRDGALLASLASRGEHAMRSRAAGIPAAARH